MADPESQSTTFAAFYAGPYHREHRHPANLALHVFGTLAGLAVLIGGLASPAPYVAILFPVAHAVPGLIGHRLFERAAAVGDIRITRSDYPMPWFMLANHLLVLDLLGMGPGRWGWEPRAEP